MKPFLMIDGEDAVLKSYKSSTIGKKSILRLEFEVKDHLNLGYVLQRCANFQAEQKAAFKADVSPQKNALNSLPSPLLQLPYHGLKE